MNRSLILKNQKGQGLTEYMLLVALIAIATLAVTKQFGSVVKERIDDAKQKIVDQVSIR